MQRALAPLVEALRSVPGLAPEQAPSSALRSARERERERERELELERGRGLEPGQEQEPEQE